MKVGSEHSGYPLHRTWPFERNPLLVFWETTKACMLACKHCRASAILKSLPGELTTEEAYKLIDDVAAFGQPYPILVLTGGDPLLRSDIWDIIAYAKGKGLRLAVAPAVSPNLTEDKVKKLAELGVDGVSISLDGSRPEIHDGIRGTSGVFEKTLWAIKTFQEYGVRVQVNTAVMRDNVHDLADIAALLLKLGVKVWEVFYLVPVGRAQLELNLTPEEWEDVSHFLYEASKYGLVVRTSEGPMFRRVAITRMLLELAGKNPDEALNTGPLYRQLVSRLRQLLGEPQGKPLASTTGTRDGKGVIFVSYNGTVYPSGFMPYPLGNIRVKSLVEIYRENLILKRLRGARFEGRCGRCEFREICGGSRARAYAVTGKPFGEDPACPYRPGTFSVMVSKLGVRVENVVREIEGLKYVLPPG
ncbi:TIGR04053 family radical SAM/SPASM domain-containing protein [Hyperthermus butylicus]|uniref:Fe-S oxidoreductase-arylsulfatase regulator AslB n=1 Tax=Hyperthermus butylicus (strain DSM 5456 / JCM 9403 / PLM1-5) TaxID=415426 RepID=A2BIS2_HYPBU|nr:TIGR04053 family radical SAM/SPASM domain-containing protein [Hyperthermus butylicus]ABM79913.1 Fe-S oxidoreductase - arylsulfatase regulator AslB [Hyperthermus butylicus DSM 5456]